jgi:cell division protein FtsQ
VSIFRLGLEAKRKQVESLPWVQSATLTRVFPNRLLVRVTERAPVAFVNLGGRVSLVDSDAVVLEKPENATFDFPVLAGLDVATSVEERRARLALYQEFMRQLGDEAPRAGWLISEVDLADPDDLQALLVQGSETLQVHFGNQDFLERFHNFLPLLPELRQGKARLDSVDLRYRNQIVVNPQPHPADHP